MYGQTAQAVAALPVVPLQLRQLYLLIKSLPCVLIVQAELEHVVSRLRQEMVTIQNNFIAEVLNIGSASFSTSFNANGIYLANKP
jgi:hypothetical protein